MAAAHILFADVMISGDEVANGKPNPACYLLGAHRLGFDPAKCLVFEDATAGILAGEDAGAHVAVITAMHRHPIETQHLTVSDYRALCMEVRADQLSLRLR